MYIVLSCKSKIAIKNKNINLANKSFKILKSNSFFCSFTLKQSNYAIFFKIELFESLNEVQLSS